MENSILDKKVVPAKIGLQGIDGKPGSGFLGPFIFGRLLLRLVKESNFIGGKCAVPHHWLGNQAAEG
jgi:hypothetical protein